MCLNIKVACWMYVMTVRYQACTRVLGVGYCILGRKAFVCFIMFCG